MLFANAEKSTKPTVSALKRLAKSTGSTHGRFLSKNQPQNTGNLDTRTSFEILVLFQKLHAEGRTLIFVTHNPEIAQYSSRNIRLRDGHVVEDTINPQILSAAAALAALPKNDED